MDSKFEIEDSWTKYELQITNEYGFNHLSITDFVKRMKDCLIEKGCKRILDLGCGSGRHSIYFNKNGFNVYASDINCEKISENIERLGLDNINVCEHSFTSIPYGREFFDAVICMSTIHHAELGDINKGISEIYRVLKPGGYLIFDVISKQDDSYGLGTPVEENTFVGSREGEENIPHHYTDEKELQMLLNLFSKVEINKSIYTFYDAKGKKYVSKNFDVSAIK